MADLSTTKTLKFELVSPERILASEDAVMVVVPGADGDFGAMADHAPLVSSIRPGVVSVHLPSGDVKKIFITAGFADVTAGLCSVLAEEAVNVADIDRVQVENELKNLNGELADTSDDARATTLKREIAIAEAKLLAAAA